LKSHLVSKHKKLWDHVGELSLENARIFGAEERANAERAASDFLQMTSRQQSMMMNFKKRKTKDPNGPRTAIFQAAYMVATRSSFHSASTETPWLSALVDAAGGRRDLLAGQRVVGGWALDFLYEFCITRMLRFFREAMAFSISFDLWSSRCLRKSLLAISFFYVDDDLLPQELVLDAIPFSSRSHTSEAVALAVAQRVDSHSTDDQYLFTITTDNALNVANASNELILRHEELVDRARRGVGDLMDGIQQLTEEEMRRLGAEDVEVAEEGDEDAAEYEDMHIGCIAHGLHLAVGDLLKEARGLKAFVRQVSAIVAATRRSTKRQAELRRLQEERGVRPLVLIGAVDTRWNSVLAMLERFRQLWGYLAVMFCRNFYLRKPSSVRIGNEDRLLILPQQDYTNDMVSAASAVLAPIRAASTFVQGSSYSASPHVPAMIWRLFDDLNAMVTEQVADAEEEEEEEGDMPLKAEWAAILESSLRCRFAAHLTVKSPFILSAMIHPSYCGRIASMVHDDKLANGDEAIRRIMEWVELVREDEERRKRGRALAMSQSSTPAKRRRSWGTVVGDSADARPDAESVAAHAVSASRKILLRQEVIDFLDELQDLDFIEPKTQGERRAVDQGTRELYKNLKGSKSTFRSVYKILSSVNSSSATPERVFSCAGLIDGALRNQLGEEKLEKLVVLGFYLKKIENEGGFNDFIKDLNDKIEGIEKN